MPSVVDLFRRNARTLFLVLGAIWLALVFLTSSVQLLWASAVFWVAGLLMTVWPSASFTKSWSVGSGILGLFLSLYQMYFAAPLVVGAFAILAAGSAVAFLALAAVHLVLLMSLRTKES